MDKSSWRKYGFNATDFKWNHETGFTSSIMNVNVFLWLVTSHDLTRCRNSMRQLVGANVGTIDWGHEMITELSRLRNSEIPMYMSSPLKTQSC